MAYLNSDVLKVRVTAFIRLWRAGGYHDEGAVSKLPARQLDLISHFFWRGNPVFIPSWKVQVTFSIFQQFFVSPEVIWQVSFRCKKEEVRFSFASLTLPMQSHEILKSFSSNGRQWFMIIFVIWTRKRNGFDPFDGWETLIFLLLPGISTKLRRPRSEYTVILIFQRICRCLQCMSYQCHSFQ